MNPEDFETNAVYVDIDTRYKNDSLFIYKDILELSLTGLMHKHTTPRANTP